VRAAAARSRAVLYVSLPYATATHRCACGCGNEVVTPLSPADWQLHFDGVSISLTPSIGNWNFPCRSHYFIKHNNVQWARQWSQAEIEAGRANERLRADEYCAGRTTSTPDKKKGRWQWVRDRLF
jgi:hypothetical protein